MKRIITMIIALACALALTQCAPTKTHEEQEAFNHLQQLFKPEDDLRIDKFKLTFTETLRSELEERLDFFTNCGDIDYRREFMITYCKAYPILHKDENLDRVTFTEYTADFSYRSKPGEKARKAMKAVFRFNEVGNIVALRFIDGSASGKWILDGRFFSIPEYYKYMADGNEKEGDLAASLSR